MMERKIQFQSVNLSTIRRTKFMKNSTKFFAIFFELIIKKHLRKHTCVEILMEFIILNSKNYYWWALEWGKGGEEKAKRKWFPHHLQTNKIIMKIGNGITFCCCRFVLLFYCDFDGKKTINENEKQTKKNILNVITYVLCEKSINIIHFFLFDLFGNLRTRRRKWMFIIHITTRISRIRTRIINIDQ